ncbi:MAG: hypothetical protein IJ856_05880 [Candidatus Methanomethylophilaceae archaeon]|nr:hypothetical protein [Candidatus Methanomethylophilaceae archaeon]
MGRRYPDGIYDFRSLVTGGYHFVDKTMLISEVCEADGITFLYTVRAGSGSPSTSPCSTTTST